MNNTISELQTRLTFQEDAVDQLNRVVARQQAEIDRLESELKKLTELVQDLKDAGPARQAEDEMPPHY